MKNFVAFLFYALMFGVAFAAGENIPTSKSYVDSVLSQKQDKILANDAVPQVLINTGTGGEYGTKNIYNSNASYATQTDALVDAVTMNAAVQNAIDSEFECIEYQNNECLLMRLGGANTVPSGYTALEYLESTGTQYIDFGQPIGTDENITAKFMYTDDSRGTWFGAPDGTDWRSPTFTFSYPTENPLKFMVYTTGNTNLQEKYYYARNPCEIGVPYIINWYGNPYKVATLYPELGWSVTSHESYTPTRNAFLFKANSPNFTASTVGRKMRIYYFRVEGKFDLVPAQRNSDGALGMYDNVSRTFFTNSGNGNFIAGPVVYLPNGN